mgnify:CR=1 FL=1
MRTNTSVKSITLINLDHTVQLFFDLLKSFIITDSCDRHSRYCGVLGGSYSKTVQIVAFSGEKSGDFGQNTYLVLNIERNPSFFSFLYP